MPQDDDQSLIWTVEYSDAQGPAAPFGDEDVGGLVFSLEVKDNTSTFWTVHGSDIAPASTGIVNKQPSFAPGRGEKTQRACAGFFDPWTVTRPIDYEFGTTSAVQWPLPLYAVNTFT